MADTKITPYLVTENSFLAVDLVSTWLQKFGAGSVALRSNCPSNSNARIEFHKAHVGKTELTAHEFEELKQLYGGISESEKALLARAGIPSLPDNIYESGVINFIGDNLNASLATDWLDKANSKGARFLLCCVQMLKHPTWLQIAGDGRVYNVHSAVLPFAAGMFAIENIATMKNAKRFEASAGATLHYINAGVDEGQVIKVARLPEPFSYTSIWDAKAASYQAAFNLLIELAETTLQRDEAWRPSSKIQDFTLRLHPAFTKKGFTPEKRTEAMSSYEVLREEHNRDNFIPDDNHLKQPQYGRA